MRQSHPRPWPQAPPPPRSGVSSAKLSPRRASPALGKAISTSNLGAQWGVRKATAHCGESGKTLSLCVKFASVEPARVEELVGPVEAGPDRDPSYAGGFCISAGDARGPDV